MFSALVEGGTHSDRKHPTGENPLLLKRQEVLEVTSGVEDSPQVSDVHDAAGFFHSNRRTRTSAHFLQVSWATQ